jgi:hypothetical protein
VSQQDQVDQIEYQLRNARAHTECGADEVEKSKLAYMCGAMNVQEAGMFSNIGANPRNLADLSTAEGELKWSTPFETIRDDLRDVVGNDLLGFGKDIVQSSKRKITGLAGKTCRCADDSIVESVMSDEEEELLKA